MTDQCYFWIKSNIIVAYRNKLTISNVTFFGSDRTVYPVDDVDDGGDYEIF